MPRLHSAPRWPQGTIRSMHCFHLRRPRAAVRACLALLLPALTLAPAAQAEPVTQYRGLIGDEQVDLALIHDSAWGAVSGVLSGADHRRVPLERTPYAEDASLVVNAQPPGDDLREAALALRPFPVSARRLQGRWVDLRTREARPLDLQRATRFETGPDSPAFDGDLLQATGGDRYFSVHASKPSAAVTGRVDRVAVHDTTSGALLQTLDGLDLWFDGIDTIEALEINGDGIDDVRATGFGDGNRAGPTQYFLSEDGRYRRAPALEALAARGPLRFEAGEVALRLSDTIDWDDRTCLWERYRFTGPIEPELVDTRRERCS